MIYRLLCIISVLLYPNSNALFANLVLFDTQIYEPHCEKTGFLSMRKQGRRSASQLLRS